MSFLFPLSTHEDAPRIHEQFGPTPIADFLIPIFDEWWSKDTQDVFVREFWAIGRLLLGGHSGIDSLGNPAITTVVFDTDGEIQALDSLRACADNLVSSGFFAGQRQLSEFLARDEYVSRVILAPPPTPMACRGCKEEGTCGGGYLPNRFSEDRGFDNQSVWCADLLAIFDHIRSRMSVSTQETKYRRLKLHQNDATGDCLSERSVALT